MSRITTLRESIETKLDQWQSSALAMEAQLGLTRDKALERVEAQKQRFRDALEGFKTEIKKSAAIADDIKTRITTQIDQMQVQLNLGKMEAKDTFESQKKKLQTAIAEFESNVDRELNSVEHKLEQSFNAVTRKMVDETNALEAEFEAMQTQFEVGKAKVGVEFEAKKNELNDKINWFKNEISEKKQLASDKAAGFEQDLSAGLAKIKDAFTNLRH